MFVSFEYTADTNSISVNDHMLHHYSVRVVDDYFVHNETGSTYDAVPAIVAVINAYEQRNLPVASNLFKALIYATKKYWSSLESWHRMQTIGSSKYQPYIKDIEKLMLLL